eukprot:TRINITY_DN13622_c0_g1_i1.p1 TRINITY_DN13622_c0_g1~~TRINITY_DN13622_c0_g1_i1.p1  ORF type:complete len:104 (+),score=18.93 TRINITY_DN13622_c0_g1_i1:25-312(+)
MLESLTSKFEFCAPLASTFEDSTALELPLDVADESTELIGSNDLVEFVPLPLFFPLLDFPAILSLSTKTKKIDHMLRKVCLKNEKTESMETDCFE